MKHICGLAFLFLFASSALAQEVEDPKKIPKRPDLKIARVQVGFAAGAFSGMTADADGGKLALFKVGSWTPIFVTIETGKEFRGLELVARLPDGDDITTVARLPLPPMLATDPADARKPFTTTRVIYLKPGATDSQIEVSVRSIDSGRTVGDTYRKNLMSMTQRMYLVTSVGSNLSGIRMGRTSNNEEEDDANASAYKLLKGQMHLGQIAEPDLMPDRWFGYEGNHAVILATGGNLEFWTTLSQNAYKSRREALKEYVARGGHLIVSVGRNQDVLQSLAEIRDVLPARIDPKGKADSNSLVVAPMRGGSTVLEPLRTRDAKDRIVTAKFEKLPDRPMSPIAQNVDKVPIVVQGSYGMGQVTLVGFDIDRAPVSGWSSASPFWEWLLSNAAPKVIEGKIDDAGEDRDPLFTTFQNNLEFFEGIPVISFGWVALFILGYILLIGPVDYFILKKVFKRLEWTWLTFPIIVVAVSCGAYYAAYQIKGRDTRINKVDLVDIDLQTNRAYGQTWFSIFSPRLQSWNVAVEPMGDNRWTNAASGDIGDSLISWEGKPRERRGGLFSRSWEYYSDLGNPQNDRFATGLERVPIAVWSSKTFHGQWSAPLSEDKPLIDASDLRVSEDNTRLDGRIISNLPMEVVDEAVLIWGGKAWSLRSMTRGVPKVVTIDATAGSSPTLPMTPVDDWLRSAKGTAVASEGGRFKYEQDQVAIATPGFRLWAALFQNATGDPISSGFARPLDQSWRLAKDSKDYAILLARVPTVEKAAEDAAEDVSGVTRLWLSELPTSGRPRTPLQGKIRQETYIRVMIPLTGK